MSSICSQVKWFSDQIEEFFRKISLDRLPYFEQIWDTQLKSTTIYMEHILRSPLPDIVIPECDLWTYLAQACVKFGDQTALQCSATNNRLTYTALLSRAEIFASNLLSLGFNRKFPLCVCMSNSVDFVVIAAAVWRLGGTLASANSMLTQSELQHQFDLLDPEFLICDENTVKQVLGAVSTKHKKILISGSHKDCMSLSTLYHNRNGKVLPQYAINPSDDLALILFSSGTTGLPKGVGITHKSVIAQVRVAGGPELSGSPPSCGAVFQPLSHIYGVCLTLMYLVWGTKVIILPKFTLDSYVKVIAEEKIPQMFIVPPIAVMLMNSNLTRVYNLSHLESISSGAAPLSKETEEKLQGMFKQRVHITQTWGMTELVSMACGSPVLEICNKLNLKISPGSVGRPISNVQLKVIDLESGVPLGPNKKGEVCVKSEQFMKGYYKNPEATAKTIDKDGWLHTGDIGYYDELECLFVVDKLKEVIKYKGYQVAPAELEALLLTHPEVTDAGVAGIPDTLGGELPLAWVVIQPGAKVTEIALQQFVDERIAPYKRLRGGIHFVQEIPKTVSGKILRRKIKKKMMDRLKKSKI